MRACLADLAHTQSVADSSLTVPLNIGYVKAHAVETHGDAVDVRLFRHPERLLEAALRDRPEVLGLASYGWNENLNRAVGEYRAPGGEVLRVFEYEESLRETATFDEASMFYLRKLHFLVDFCWNIEVYKPLLGALAAEGVNQVDVLRRLIECGEVGNPVLGEGAPGVRRFFERFDALSRAEWFESEAHIEAHFAEEANWRRLIGREFEKLNVVFSVVLLNEHKRDFDAAMLALARETGRLPAATLEGVFDYTRALFPPLDAPARRIRVPVPAGVDGAPRDGLVELEEGERRLQLRDVLADSGGRTLSKILNTRSFSLADLRMTVRAPGAAAG